MSLNPEVVGERSNVADADKAVAVNTQIASEAAITAEAARVEQVKLETTGESSCEQSVAKGSTEGGVYGDVGLAAATGGSATVELLQTACKVVGEGFDTSLGGMEQSVEASVSSNQQRSIYTGAFNNKANLPARSNILSGFMSGDDKVKGVKANETEISALKSIQEISHALKAEATLHAGNAINHKAGLGGQALKAQMGMAPGGASAPQLALDARAPKPPTDDMLDETGAA